MNDALNTAPVIPTYRIDAEYIGTLTDKFAKLQKRASKLGVEAPSFIVTGEHVEYRYRDFSYVEVVFRWSKVKSDGFTGATRLIKSVQLVGATSIKLAGWTFLAVLDHELGEDNTIIRMVPGADGQLPTEYRHRGNYCSHCKRSVARKATYVVKHEDGRLCQVGSTCIRDFLGHDVSKVLGQVEMLGIAREILSAGEEDFGMGGMRNPTCFDLTEYLAWVCKSIREDGWVSRKESRESDVQATADTALESMLDYYKSR